MEDPREKVRSKMSLVEKSAQHLYDNLQTQLSSGIERLHEVYNANVRQLDILVSLNPDIPFTEPTHFPFRIALKTRYVGSCSRIDRLNGDDFFLQEKSPLDHNVSLTRVSYNFEADRLNRICKRDDLVNKPQFEGKLVISHYISSDEEYERERELIQETIQETIETDTTITLPTLGSGNSGYGRYVYRASDGVVKSYAYLLEEKAGEDYRDRIIYFGNEPWLVSERKEGDYANVILRNIYSGEVRRYLLYHIPIGYIMLRNEMFYASYQERKSFHLFRCSTNELTMKLDSIVNIITMQNYCVIHCSRAECYNNELHFLCAQPEE